MIENIDNVLQALISAGGEKIDYDPNGGNARSCLTNYWSIAEDTDCSVFEHLPETITKRLCRLDICVTDNAHLQAIYDPETRRIEALEIYELDSGGVMLTLWFWPGLEVARKLTIATRKQWDKAIADGWFEFMGL